MVALGVADEMNVMGDHLELRWYRILEHEAYGLTLAVPDNLGIVVM